MCPVCNFADRTHYIINMKRLFLTLISFIILVPSYAEKDYSILYDWQTFDPIFSDDKTPDIYPIAVDGQNIYVGTSYGIVIIDKVSRQQTLINRTDGLTDNYITYLGVIGDELWYGGHDNSFGMIKDGSISNYSRSYTLPNSTVWITAIEKDKEGNLWVGSLGDLLKFADGELAGRYPFPYGDAPVMMGINKILVEDDTIWVLGYDMPGTQGLAKLTANGLEMVYEDPGMYDFIKDHLGNMWMTGQKGLIKYHDGTFTEYQTDKNGESLGGMTDLTEDKEGNFWAIRESCLVKYDKEQITSYQSPFFYLFDMVMDDDGIYISASHNGVLIFKDGQFEHIPLQKFPGQLPNNNGGVGMTRGGSIDHDGNYLAGTGSGYGLLKLKPDGTCIETDFFKGKYISETTTDNFGDVWVANSWGDHFYLYKITPTDTLTYDEVSGCPRLGGEDIFQMACDHENRLWIASSNGLYCFDGTTWQTFNTKNSDLTTNRVYCVAFDKDGRLWTSCGRSAGWEVEIGDGLFCYDGKGWMHYISQYGDEISRVTEGYVPLKMPIRTNSIGRIAIDDNNTFWLAVNYNEVYGTTDIDGYHGGLIRWDGGDEWHQYLSPFTPDPSYPTYEPGEWINNVDFVLPGNWINNLKFDRDGRLWVTFEGKHGVAMYNGKDFTVWDTEIPGIRSGSAFNLCVDKERDRLWISHRYENGASTANIRCNSTDMLSTPRLLPNRGGQRSGKMYDLNGRQIPEPRHGEVYIKDGKKLIEHNGVPAVDAGTVN